MGTYGLRVPASRVGYVPEAQGGLPPGPHVLGTAYCGNPGARGLLRALLGVAPHVPSSRLTRRPPSPAAAPRGRSCHSHGPGRFPFSWAVAPAASRPPASPPVVLPRLRICAPTRSQVPLLLRARRARARADARGGGQAAGRVRLPQLLQDRPRLGLGLGLGLELGLRLRLRLALGSGPAAWRPPRSSARAGARRARRSSGTCERVGAQIRSRGRATGGLAGGLEAAGAAAQEEGERPGPWLWQEWPWGAAAGEGGRHLNRLEGTCGATPRSAPRSPR